MISYVKVFDDIHFFNLAKHSLIFLHLDLNQIISIPTSTKRKNSMAIVPKIV